MGNLLTLFVIPDDEREARIEAWAARQKGTSSYAPERSGLAQKLERSKALYLEGEFEEAEYRRVRVETEARLAQIPPDDVVTPRRVSKRLSALLANMAETWKVAMPEERNAIARELFFDVVIEDRAIVAVKPRPEAAPFFQQLPGVFAHDGASITQGRKRRGSLAGDRCGRATIGPLSPRR